MKTYSFVIAYDIADAKRLRKVAKALEKVALRIQNSIFLYKDTTKEELQNIVEILQKIIDNEKDDVRIYKANLQKSFHLQSGIDLQFPSIIKG